LAGALAVVQPEILAFQYVNRSKQNGSPRQRSGQVLKVVLVTVFYKAIN
jgi:hypothetical protein